MKKFLDGSVGMLAGLEKIGLLLIAMATLIAGSQDIAGMIAAGRVSLGDLLMLFLYLEVLSMVRHYMSTGTLPVRYPLYIGIVALTRFLVLDIKELAAMQVMALAFSTLMLSLAVLVLRFGHVKFPYPSGDDGGQGAKRDAYK